MNKSKYCSTTQAFVPAAMKHPLMYTFGFTASNSYESYVYDVCPFFDPDKTTIIYSGYVRFNDINILTAPIDWLVDFVKSVYVSGNNLVFDNAFEGGIDDILAIIHTIMEKTPSINKNDVYYISGAANVNEEYKKFCIRNTISNEQMINVIGVSIWELSSKRQCLLDVNYSHVRDKTLLCFNRKVRLHRTLLVSQLIEYDLLDKSFISYFPNNTHGYRTSLENELHVLKYTIQGYPELYTTVEKTMLENARKFPLKLNIEPEYNKTHVDNDDIVLFQNSHFSLVTETYFFVRQYTYGKYSVYDHHAVFFTDKIFKPIKMKHPFIVVSRPGFLRHLRKRGYRTFAPIIDESYDDIENDVDRMNAIVNECIRLSKLSDHEWKLFHESVHDIIEHNHNKLHQQDIYILDSNTKKDTQ